MRTASQADPPPTPCRALESGGKGTVHRGEWGQWCRALAGLASLKVPRGADPEGATKLLEKAEHVCLMSTSLVAEGQLVRTVHVG